MNTVNRHIRHCRIRLKEPKETGTLFSAPGRAGQGGGLTTCVASLRRDGSHHLDRAGALFWIRGLEMHDPPHPGEVLRGLYLEPLGFTVTEAARRIDVTRKTLSELVNGRAGVSPEMALRIGAATKTTAESWLNTSFASTNKISLKTFVPEALDHCSAISRYVARVN